MLDRLLLESYLVLVQKGITAQLAHMPVDVRHTNSEYMVQRGNHREVFRGFCIRYGRPG